MTQFIKGDSLQLDNKTLPTTGQDGEMRFDPATTQLVRYSVANSLWERVNAGESLEGDLLQLKTNIPLPVSGAEGEVRYDPATDELKIYNTTSSSWLSLGGGGGGGLNFFSDPNSFTDSVESTTTITNVPTEVLGTLTTYKINFSVSATLADKSAFQFTIPRGFQGRLLKLSFLFEKSTGFIDDDVQAVIVHDPAGTPVDVSQNVTLIKDFQVFETPFFAVDDDTKLDYALEFRDNNAAKAIEFFVGELTVDAGNGGIATQGGWKTYTEADVVTSSNQPGYIVGNARFTPYKDPVNDTWRMTFNINATITSVANMRILIGGISFNASANFHQPISVSDGSTVPPDGLAVAGTNYIEAFASSGVFTTIRFSGDVQLNDQPTFVDFDNTIQTLDQNVLFENSRVKVEGLLTGPSVSGVRTLIYQNIKYQEGIQYNVSTGEFIVNSTGQYSLKAMAAINNANTTTINLLVRVNGSSLKQSFSSSTNEQYFNLKDTIALQKDDSVFFELDTSGLVTTLQTQDNRVGVVISRLPDKNVGAPIGFAEAANGNLGIVEVNSGIGNVVGGLREGATSNPITTTVQVFDWHQVGKQVTLKVDIRCSTVTGNDAMFFFDTLATSFPGMPLPKIPTGITLGTIASGSAQVGSNESTIGLVGNCLLYLSAGTIRFYIRQNAVSDIGYANGLITFLTD